MPLQLPGVVRSNACPQERKSRSSFMPRRSLVVAPILALLAVAAVADSNVDLPVATQGTEQWAGVVAKAMSAGGRSQDESLQALSSFQERVFSKISKTVGRSALSVRLCLIGQNEVASSPYTPTQWYATAGLFRQDAVHVASCHMHWVRSRACLPSQMCAAVLTASGHAHAEQGV